MAEQCLFERILGLVYSRQVVDGVEVVAVARTMSTPASWWSSSTSANATPRSCRRRPVAALDSVGVVAVDDVATHRHRFENDEVTETAVIGRFK